MRAKFGWEISSSGSTRQMRPQKKNASCPRLTLVLESLDDTLSNKALKIQELIQRRDWFFLFF